MDKDCKPCRAKRMNEAASRGVLNIREQRAREWGKANGHLSVSLYEVPDEDGEPPRVQFAESGNPVLAGKKIINNLWCN